MLRLIGFFLGTLVLLFVLRALPVVGGIFRVPLLGFYLSAIMLSVLIAKYGALAIDRRRFARLRRELGAVDTPHNRGKLGSLLLAQGRARQAIEHLEAAAAGEPDSAEWRYRLGCALLRASRPPEAAVELEQAGALREDHAYGAVWLRLAEARRRSGEPEAALEALDRHADLYGPSPESAYRRGRALRALGRREEAAASFAQVGRLARQAPKYQRGEARLWALRAFLGRLI